ncbi:hypothetical protein, partial [Helicobacter suis]
STTSQGCSMKAENNTQNIDELFEEFEEIKDDLSHVEEQLAQIASELKEIGHDLDTLDNLLNQDNPQQGNSQGNS